MDAGGGVIEVGDVLRGEGETAAWRRSVLSTALNYAVEQQFLGSNPVGAIKWTATKAVEAVDRRSVANPTQARALLAAVTRMPRSGKRMVAFFGAMYYSALRPEEAASLRRRNLDLPKEGWGWITLEQAAPEVARQWSDSDRRREDRELKHRAPGESRRVPCPPALTKLFRAHLDEFGTDSEGRLLNATRSSRMLSPASVSGSLCGSGSGVPMATEIVAQSPVGRSNRVGDPSTVGELDSDDWTTDLGWRGSQGCYADVPGMAGRCPQGSGPLMTGVMARPLVGRHPVGVAGPGDHPQLAELRMSPQPPQCRPRAPAM